MFGAGERAIKQDISLQRESGEIDARVSAISINNLLREFVKKLNGEDSELITDTQFEWLCSNLVEFFPSFLAYFLASNEERGSAQFKEFQTNAQSEIHKLMNEIKPVITAEDYSLADMFNMLKNMVQRKSKT